MLALERTIGINVNAVAPAAATRMNARLLGERAALLAPDAIAPVVAFLAHRDCTLSGQILPPAAATCARSWYGDPRHHRPAAERGRCGTGWTRYSIRKNPSFPGTSAMT